MLPEVVVDATALEEGFTSVRRVTRDALERRGAASVADALEKEAAFHGSTDRRGERVVSLRGFELRQVAVLIDGLPASIPYDGQIDLGALPAAMAEAVTVVKGPASVLYGPGGLGGAINITTRRPGSGPPLSVRAELGRAGAMAIGAWHTLRLGPRFAYALYGGLERRDAFALPARYVPDANERGGLRDNSDRRLDHAGAALRLELAPGHELSASGTFIDGQKGVPPSATSSVPEYRRFTSWRALGATLGHEGRIGRLQLDEVAFLRLFDNRLDGFDDATYSTQRSPRAFATRYHDMIAGGRLRLRRTLSAMRWWHAHLRLAANASFERHAKEDLLGPTASAADPISRMLATASPEAELGLGSRYALTAALQLDLEALGSMPASGGSSSRADVGPLLSFRAAIRPDLRLAATAARRVRAPTLKERFTDLVPGREPNPDLGSEAAWHFGLEASFSPREWLELRAAGFDAEVSRLIELVPLATSGAGSPARSQLRNVGDARLAGLELEIEVAPASWVQLAAGALFLHARRTDAAAPEDRLAYRPELKSTVSLELLPVRWLALWTALQVVGQQAFRNPDTGAWGRLGSYLVWDARAEIRLVRWGRAWVRAANLLDSSYQTEHGFPEPGREVWVGLELSPGALGKAATGGGLPAEPASVRSDLAGL